jgi:hypothetical protein
MSNKIQNGPDAIYCVVILMKSLEFWIWKTLKKPNCYPHVTVTQLHSDDIKPKAQNGWKSYA